MWRARYAEYGLAGLADEERTGRPPVYGHDDVLLLVKTVTEPPPDGATRWTMEALAGASLRAQVGQHRRHRRHRVPGADRAGYSGGQARTRPG